MDTVILPEGSTLFHGTIEDLGGKLQPGGYDEVLWFADSAAVAQLYIPRSGTTLYVSSDSVSRPTEDPTLQSIQHMIGLDYDLDQVEWDSIGRPRSYKIPEGWEDVGLNFEKIEEVERRLEEAGYEGTGTSGFRRYAFHIADDRVLPHGGVQQGTLCVATTIRDMKIWRKALGEGDLMNVQYHDVEGFLRAAALGFDGVLIDDFAQSEKWGNLGHFALGIFGPAIVDLDIECVPATYEEWDRRQETEAWPYPSPTNFGKLFRQPNPMQSLKASLMPPRR